RAEYLGWLHCRQINEIVDHCAWMSSQPDSRVAYPRRILVFLANCYFALLLQRGNKHAEAAEYWRCYLAQDGKSEWARAANPPESQHPPPDWLLMCAPHIPKHRPSMTDFNSRHLTSQ